MTSEHNTPEMRELVRSGVFRPTLRARIEAAYYPGGVPGVVIETDAIEREAVIRTLREVWTALLELGAENGKSDDFYAGWAALWNDVLSMMDAHERGPEARDLAIGVRA